MTYTKQRVTIQRVTKQHTEVVYYRDGEEIGREEIFDAHEYDAEPMEEMTEQEIEDWTND